MDMYTNRIGRGFWVLLYSGLIIVGYLIAHENVSFLQQNSSGYPPFTALVRSIQPAIDTCSTDALLTVQEADADSSLLTVVPETPVVEDPPPFEGGEKLLRFFASLRGLEETPQKRVRIAYFGDSFIEGDLVTQSLRNNFQERFGGEGVGFVPITSPAAGFRKTIKQSASKEWQRFSFLKPNPTDYDFGISGELFLGPNKKRKKSPAVWVQYEGQSTYPATRNFRRVKLFYGKAQKEDNSSYMVRTLPNHADTIQLEQKGVVNQILLAQGKTEEIRLDFAINEELPIYGLSFESTQGVHLDNYASRGNSGMNLINLSPAVLKRFNRHFDYDLIVLHYGLNVITPGRTNYKSYEKGMRKVVKHIKENFPNADIMMVSVSDKSYKIDGKMKTDICVPYLVASQKKLAEEMEVAFLNLYEKMGGANSMVKWVEADPPLAHHDYTHPNRRGAEKVSNIISEFLMREYGVFVEAEEARSPLRPADMPVLHSSLN